MRIAFLILLIASIMLGLTLVGLGLFIRYQYDPTGYYVSGISLILVFSLLAILLDKKIQ